MEKLLSKDIEIIFMTDSVDEYTVQHLTEYEGKRLINASREGLKLEEGDVEKKRDEQYKVRPVLAPPPAPPPYHPAPSPATLPPCPQPYPNPAPSPTLALSPRSHRSSSTLTLQRDAPHLHPPPPPSTPYQELFKPLLDYTKELLGKKVQKRPLTTTPTTTLTLTLTLTLTAHPHPHPHPHPHLSPLTFHPHLFPRQVEKVQISKHLVNSPVVVLSADYGWTAQMEKVMKSQAFADQSKFEFMKSKRMFEINPRHPMIVELNSRVKDSSADEQTKDMVTTPTPTHTHARPSLTPSYPSTTHLVPVHYPSTAPLVPSSSPSSDPSPSPSPRL